MISITADLCTEQQLGALTLHGTSNPKTAKNTYSSMKICMSSLGKCLLNIFNLLLIELFVF